MAKSRTGRVLGAYGYRAKKSKGQRFLVREDILQRIVDLAGIRPDETVLEIGPGPGNLTRRLVRAAERVIAIELEHELAMILKVEVKADNLEVIEADALAVDFGELKRGPGRIKVVSNLPYHVATPILFKLLEARELFSELILLVQKEVALRIAAAPGKKTYGVLSAQVGLLADREVLMTVGPEAFSPRPKVDSALLRLTILDQPRHPVADLEVYRRVVRAAFARRRKTIKNSFAAEAHGFQPAAVLAALEAVGIDLTRRAETISLEEFAAIANHLAKGAEGKA